MNSRKLRRPSAIRRRLVRSVRQMILAGSAAWLIPQSVHAAALMWDGQGADSNWATATNWVGDAAPAAGDSLTFGGARNTSAANNFTANTLFNGITFDTSAGVFTLSGNAINLGGSIINESLNAQTISLNLALQATQTVNVSSIGGSLTLSGVISGSTFGLSKTGSGLLTLSNAANTFTGPVTISGGTLAIASDSTGVTNPLGSGAAGAAPLTLNGGALRTTATTQLSTNRGVALGASGGTIDVASGTLTYNGVISGTGNSFTKTGVGTLTLGGVNTYTGNTFVNLGTLKLDFTQLVGTTDNIIDSGSTLVLGGPSTALGNAAATGPTTTTAGTVVNMTSKNNANSTQTFAGLTLNGGYHTIQTTQTGTGNNLLTLGALTHTFSTAANTGFSASYGGVVNFSFAGTLGVNNAIKTTTLNSNGTTGATSGILGAWATYGPANPISSYASVDAGGNIVPYTGYTAQAAGAITSDTTKNYQQQTAGAIALTTADGATTDINTLSTSTAATGATAITIGAAGTGSTGILRAGATGGFLVGATVGTLIIGNVVNNGTLTAGGAADTAGEIAFINGNTTTNNNGFTIHSKITDNGTGVVSVIYGGTQGSGGSIASVTGTNTYSGGTTITTGRVNATNAAAFGTGSVTVYSGAQAYLGLSGTNTVANNWNLAGGGTALPGGSAGFYDSPGALRTQGNTTLSGTITLLNDAAINSRNANGDTITGQITGGYNLIITSNGATGGNFKISNTTNNWTGNLIVETKTLLLGASGVIPNGAGKGNVVLSANAASILDLNNFDETINGLSSTGNSIVRNSVAGTKTLTLGDGDATATFGGVIGTSTGQVAITKIGSGTQVLSGTNTTTGAISVQAGTLQLTGANSTAGTTSITGGTLLLGGTGTINSSAGITVSGSGARLLHTGGTAISPTVTLTNGTVQGAGSTINTVNVADLAANTITVGLGGTGNLTINSLTFSGAATVNIPNTLVLTTTTLTANGAANSITLNSSGAWTTGNTYNLATFVGGSIGGTAGVGAFVKGMISGLGARQNATLGSTSSAITLTIGGDTPVWTGAAGGVWSQTAVGSHFNWKLQSTQQDTEFLNNDAVIFADTTPGGGAPTTTAVTINDATVTPASVSFTNSAVNYTLSGSNGISTGTLTKTGTGTLTIQAPNTFTGATTVNGGIVNYQNGTAFGSSPITVASGVTVQVQGGITGGAATLTLSGTGAAGQNGALVNVSGTNSYAGLITLSGSAKIASDSGTLNLTNTGTISAVGAGLTLAGAGDGTLASVIGTSTGGTLTKTDAGTWTLQAQTTQNNYTGGTTVSGGTLKVVNASGGTGNITTNVLGMGAVSVASGATLWLDYELGATANSVTYPNAFSGTGTLKVTAPGSTGAGGAAILSGDLGGFTGTIDLFPQSGTLGKTSFSGGAGMQPSASATVKVENGTTLYLANGLSYGFSTELVGSGNNENLGALRLESGTNLTSGVTLLGSSSVGSNSGTGTISGDIGESGGSFGLTKLGAQTIALTGSNSYTGATTISAGTLSTNNLADGGSNSGIGASSNAAANLVINGATLKYTGAATSTDRNYTLGDSNATIDASGTGALTMSGVASYVTSNAARTLTLTGTNTNNNTYGGVLANNGTGALSLNKTGAGTWVLSGINLFTGAVTIAGGTLSVSNQMSGSNTTNAQFKVGTVTNTKATLLIGTGALINNRFNLFVGDAGSGTGGGAVYQSGGAVSLSQGAGVDNLRIGSNAGGYGYYSLSGGTLTANEVGIGASLNNTVGVMDVSGSGAFTINGYITLGRGGLTSSGVLNVTGGSAAATRLHLNYAGTSGATSVLTVGGGAGTASVSTTGSTTLGLDLANSATSGTIGAANLLTNGALTTGIVTGSQANSTALLNFNGGTLKASATNAGANFLSSANVDTVTIYSGGGTIDNSGTNITVSRPLEAATGNGVTTIAVSNGGSGYVGAPLITISGGTGNPATAYAVMADDGSGNGTYRVSSIVITSPGRYTVDPTTVTSSGGGATTAASGFTISTAANASGEMTFTGNGTTTLSGANTYTGTTINAGTLAAGNDAALGSGLVTLDGGSLGASGTRTLANNVQVNAVAGNGFSTPVGGDLTLNGNITGSGAVTKTGGGSLLLGGDNSGFAGTLSMTAGFTRFTSTSGGSTSATWDVGSGAILASDVAGSNTIALGALSGLGVVGNNTGVGSLTFSIGGNNSDTVFSGVIKDDVFDFPADPVNIVKTGTGTTTFSGANTYAGSTTINGGTLSVSASSNLGNASATNTLTLAGGTLESTGTSDLGATRSVALGAAGGAFRVTSGNSLTISGSISGTTGMSKLGAGTLVVTSDNSSTFSGPTTISAGTFIAANTTGSATGSGDVTIEANATLGGTGQVTGNVNVNADGILSPGTSIGTLFTGPLTLSGGAEIALEINTSTQLSDLVRISAAAASDGDFTLSGAVNLAVTDQQAGVLSLHDHFTFITYSGDRLGSGFFRVAGFDYDLTDYTGDDASAAFFTLNGTPFAIDYNYNDAAFPGVSAVALVVVPEPNSAAMLVGGLGCLLGLQRLRRTGRRSAQ